MNRKYFLLFSAIIPVFLFFSVSLAETLGESSHFCEKITNGQAKQILILDNNMTIEVRRDEYDGYLCFYRDKHGNRNVTNNLDELTTFHRDREDVILTSSVSGGESDDDPDQIDEFDEDEYIPDPLEGLNRMFFTFNDKLYFWLLKPVASGYGAVVPKRMRSGISNVFYNLAFPIRFINCLLQIKVESAADEFGRFFINSTMGVAGLADVATDIGIGKHDEDFDQTLGVLGIGPAFYINWPILGPSSLRGTIGLAANSLVDPINYFVDQTKYELAIKGYKTINSTSLRIGEYEELKKAAFDPYVAMRDAYYQYRSNKIRE